MKNVILNLPFNHTTNISLINEIYNRYYIKTLHVISHKVISNPPDANTKQFLINQDVSVYLNHQSEVKYLFDDSPDFFKYKYNLMSIINRWARTFSISKDFHNVDLLSNKIFHYWNDYLVKNEISFILLNQPHTPHDYAIYTLSKYLGIDILLLTPINLPHKQHINYLISEDTVWNKPLIKVDEILKIKSKGSKFNHSNLFQIGGEDNISKTNFFNDYIYSIIRKALKALYKTFARIYLVIIYLLEIIYKMYVLSLTSEDIPKENYKFVYFPLHFQPEATTVPAGNHYSDLLEVLRKIYPATNSKYKIVVKEHPFYWKSKLFKIGLYNPMFITRPLRFYRELLSYKNVVFISPNVNSKHLISKSIAVVTVTGSVAYEAYLLEKPTFIFGEHYYLKLPNVKKFQYSIFNEFLDNPSDYSKQITSSESYKNFPKVVKANSIEKTHLKTQNGLTENNLSLNTLYFTLDSYLEKK